MERFKTLLGYYPMYLKAHSIVQENIMRAYAEIGRERGIYAMTFDDRDQDGFLPAHEIFNDIQPLMEGYYNTGFTPNMLMAVLDLVKDNPHEINILHCHPGYEDAYLMDNTTLVLPRCRDLQTFCDKRVIKFINDKKIELISLTDPAI
jgi:predicted glycoside hydrolase/deacetylase ChbG (UPF0249 family)